MVAGLPGKPSMADEVHIINDHIHGVQQMYPSLADPIVVTGGAQWTLGAESADLIAADVVSKPFDVHHVVVSSPDTNEDYEIAILGGGSIIGSVAFTRTGVFLNSVQIPIMTPIQPAGTAITAKLADGGAGGGATAGVKVAIHEY